MDIEYYSAVFKTLSHPARLKIAQGLLSKKECNVLLMAETLSLPQPIVSQHLAVMKRAGILDSRREGNKICYFLADEKVKKMLKGIA